MARTYAILAVVVCPASPGVLARRSGAGREAGQSGFISEQPARPRKQAAKPRWKQRKVLRVLRPQ